MRILIIPSENFIPPQNPLSGIFEYHQAKALVKSGLRVSVLSVELKYSIPMFIKAVLKKIISIESTNELNSYSFLGLLSLFFRTYFLRSNRFNWETIDGITVIRVCGNYLWRPNHKSTFVLWNSNAILGYKKYVSKFGHPDLIHAHNCISAGYVAKKIKQKFNIPYVLTEHLDIHAIGVVDNKKRKVIISAIKEADKMIVVSKTLGDVLSDKYEIDRQKFIFIPNVLDSVFEENLPIDNSASMPLSDKNHFNFINIANCDKNKNQKNLLKAFSRSFSKAKNIRLRIVGTGELLDGLMNLSVVLGISGQVSFDGRLSRTDVLSAICQSNVLVLNSNYETFGVVLIESLVCGKPIVATACGGPESIVEPHNGLLVPVQDVVSLSTALKEIYINYQKYDPAYIRTDCLKKYGSLPIALELIKLYNTIIQ